MRRYQTHAGHFKAQQTAGASCYLCCCRLDTFDTQRLHPAVTVVTSAFKSANLQDSCSIPCQVAVVCEQLLQRIQHPLLQLQQPKTWCYYVFYQQKAAAWLYYSQQL
jgi:hypothetical protein